MPWLIPLGRKIYLFQLNSRQAQAYLYLSVFDPDLSSGPTMVDTAGSKNLCLSAKAQVGSSRQCRLMPIWSISVFDPDMYCTQIKAIEQPSCVHRIRKEKKIQNNHNNFLIPK